jgi:hypothetical protein
MGRPVAEKPRSLCPSAQPDWRGSRLIGVVGGTADDPRVSLLAPPRPVTDALLQLADPVHPTEVFRFAAPCLCSGCDLRPEVAIDLPECDIRPHCRWWQQEGRPACLRCAQIVTENLNPSDPMREAALPVVQR